MFLRVVVSWEWSWRKRWRGLKLKQARKESSRLVERWAQELGKEKACQGELNALQAVVVSQEDVSCSFPLLNCTREAQGRTESDSTTVMV